MPEDEYELTPRKEIDFLRREVEALKRNAGGPIDTTSLVLAVNQLNSSITHLTQILEGANDEMVKSFHDTSVQEQMRKMMEQNEKLARGIVAVADLVKESQLQPKPVASPPPGPSTPNPFMQDRVHISNLDVPPPPGGF